MQLNYFPIHFDFSKYQINTEPYSEDRLKELRLLYNTTHSFFRNGDLIYISNKDSDENLTSTNLMEKSVYDDNEVTASLIKHLFFRTFKDIYKEYTPVDFYPFRFFSGQEKDDIIYNLLPDKLKNHIAYKKLIEIQLRLTNINGKTQFGFLINIKRNWIFDKTCAELNDEGYDLSGIEVLHAEELPGLSNILAPNEELIGELIKINGRKAEVKTNQGIREYELDELFIRKTKFNIGKYLEFATTPSKSVEILNLIENKRSEIYSPKNLYNQIRNIAKYLFSKEGEPIVFKNKDGFYFTVDKEPINVPNSMELKIPTFIFDYSATKTNNYPDLGLSNYGPYDSMNFPIKTPNILCICNRNIRGHFTKFLLNLKDGVPESKYFQKGFQKKYDLQDINYTIKEISAYNIDEYIDVIKNYDYYPKPDLAIVEIPFEFRKYEDIDNPYYRIKAKLLSLEIPIQFVTKETIEKHNENILNSVALQLYAKLGGTPWVLPAERSVDKEIIIGIGHSWLRNNQYRGAEQNRVVGITTFLSGDGQYLLGDKVKDVSFENYFSELLKSLNQSINHLSVEQGWSEGDTLRLIFHIFKPIKNVEFDVICQLIKDLPKYKIKFAFVTISKFHPNLLFDINQQGIRKLPNNPIKGEFIPCRGSNVFLDEETCIVQMFGPRELKTAKQGISTPIQIKIRKPKGNYNNIDIQDSLFHDLNYITQQIFSFTYLSWRSFLPGEKPATMLYSDLIANLLGKMRNIPEWDADNLNYGLKRKKWFL
ncbi:MAG: argonaute/piwi family protein [Bacteroidales bacterium]